MHHITPHALRDFDDIWFYIAEDSTFNADRFTTTLWKKVGLLAERPLLGRLRSDLSPTGQGIRSFAYKAYTFFYQPIDNGIILFRVLHSSRDVTTDLLHLDDN